MRSKNHAPPTTPNRPSKTAARGPQERRVAGPASKRPLPVRNAAALLRVLVLWLLSAGLTGTALADLQGWFLPSTIKVMRDAKPLASVPEARLAAARNETEACQLVLLANEDLANVTVTVTELRRRDSRRALYPALFKVAYVPNIVGHTPYPDPLPPLPREPFQLTANQAQPIWVSVRVPKEAPAGDYWGELRVEAGKQHRSFRLNVHVWNFTLPDTPACVTAFGMDADSIARQHGVAPTSPVAKALYTAYYEMLLDHRISAYDLPVDLLSDEAARYLNDPRLTSFVIPYSEDDRVLQRLVARLMERGAYRKGVFYPIDEPVKPEAYDRLGKIAQRLHRLAPGGQWVVPFYRGPEGDTKQTVFDLLTGRANVWCPNAQYFDTDPLTRPYLADRRRLGEQVWWYVCCGPGAPYNNFFVEMNALSHRVLFWQQKRENVGGLLYWNTTWWNPRSTTDPWADMATVKDINPNIHGDGALLYPGSQVGIAGPVSSIRLEVIRDGLEDFDYLTLADRALGPDATLKLVQRVARTLQEYETDPVAFELVRRLLGEQLEKMLPRVAKQPPP